MLLLRPLSHCHPWFHIPSIPSLWAQLPYPPVSRRTLCPKFECRSFRCVLFLLGYVFIASIAHEHPKTRDIFGVRQKHGCDFNMGGYGIPASPHSLSCPHLGAGARVPGVEGARVRGRGSTERPGRDAPPAVVLPRHRGAAHVAARVARTQHRHRARWSTNPARDDGRVELHLHSVCSIGGFHIGDARSSF